MLTHEKIREDLREVRYYYSMQDLFDSAAKTIKPIAILEKVSKYNEAIKNAPARLYILYVSLYVNNSTQTALADDWGYTREYIRELNQALVEYLQKTIT